MQEGEGMGSRTQGKSCHWQERVIPCQKPVAKQRGEDANLGSTETGITYSQQLFFRKTHNFHDFLCITSREALNLAILKNQNVCLSNSIFTVKSPTLQAGSYYADKYLPQIKLKPNFSQQCIILAMLHDQKKENDKIIVFTNTKKIIGLCEDSLFQCFLTHSYFSLHLFLSR